MHLCLHDTKEQKIDAAFKMIYEFIEAAIIPDEFSPAKTDRKEPLKIIDSDFPVSNQVLHVNCKKQETRCKAKD